MQASVQNYLSGRRIEGVPTGGSRSPEPMQKRNEKTGWQNRCAMIIALYQMERFEELEANAVEIITLWSMAERGDALGGGPPKPYLSPTPATAVPEVCYPKVW